MRPSATATSVSASQYTRSASVPAGHSRTVLSSPPVAISPPEHRKSRRLGAGGRASGGRASRAAIVSARPRSHTRTAARCARAAGGAAPTRPAAVRGQTTGTAPRPHRKPTRRQLGRRARVARLAWHRAPHVREAGPEVGRRPGEVERVVSDDDEAVGGRERRHISRAVVESRLPSAVVVARHGDGRRRRGGGVVAAEAPRPQHAAGRGPTPCGGGRSAGLLGLTARGGGSSGG